MAKKPDQKTPAQIEAEEKANLSPVAQAQKEQVAKDAELLAAQQKAEAEAAMKFQEEQAAATMEATGRGSAVVFDEDWRTGIRGKLLMRRFRVTHPYYQIPVECAGLDETEAVGKFMRHYNTGSLKHAPVAEEIDGSV